MRDQRGLHVVIVPSWWPSAEQPLAGIFFRDFARGLASAGYRVGVVAPDLVGARHWKVTDAPWRPMVIWEELDGIPVVRIRGRHTSLGRPTIHMWRYRRWLGRGLAAYQERFGLPDLLHAMVSLPAGWACTHLEHSLSRCVVLTEHTGPFRLLLTPKRAGSMTLAALQSATEVVAVSEHLREEMKTAGVSKPIDVIGNIVGEGFVASRTPAAGRDASGRALYEGAYVGRLAIEKGLTELVAAAKLLQNEPHFSVRWHIVGVGPMEVDLKASLSAGGINAVFHGMQDPPGVAGILRDSHFLVLPSHGENFPLAICEALVCGRSVITTDVPGCAALVGPDDGVIARARDSRALAEAVRHWAARFGKWDWEAIGRRAKARFAWESVVGRFSQVYERALAGQSGLGADGGKSATE